MSGMRLPGQSVHSDNSGNRKHGSSNCCSSGICRCSRKSQTEKKLSVVGTIIGLLIGICIPLLSNCTSEKRNESLKENQKAAIKVLQQVKGNARKDDETFAQYVSPDKRHDTELIRAVSKLSFSMHHSEKVNLPHCLVQTDRVIITVSVDNFDGPLNAKTKKLVVEFVKKNSKWYISSIHNKY